MRRWLIRGTAALVSERPGGSRPSIWSAIHPRLLALIRAHRSTLIFVNSRRLSERLAPGENADHLAADLLNVTLAGLRSGVVLQSRSADCALDQPVVDAQAS